MITAVTVAPIFDWCLMLPLAGSMTEVLLFRGPPSRLRRFGETAFAWLAEPKLTLGRQVA